MYDERRSTASTGGPIRDASRTAQGVAALRAAHQTLDAPPRILDDPIAARLLDPAWLARVTGDPERLRSPGATSLRAHVLLRSRFTEDQLATAVAAGVRQFVILGAGLDTFALRQPAWAEALEIIEVDQPASQRDKRERIAAAGLTIPPNLRFADIDFEHESLRDGLRRHGIRHDVPTFFSWLGVTMYLTAPAIDAVLHTVAEFPTGSEMVLTFAQPAAEGPRDPNAGPSLADRAAEMGEPWVTFFTLEEISRTLFAAGFTRVEFLRHDEAQARYFGDRSDGLRAPRRTSIVHARR